MRTSMDLDELFPPEEPVPEQGDQPVAGQGAADPGRPAFSQNPFPVAALHSVDLSVNVNTEVWRP